MGCRITASNSGLVGLHLLILGYTYSKCCSLAIFFIKDVNVVYRQYLPSLFRLLHRLRYTGAIFCPHKKSIFFKRKIKA